MKNLKLFLLLAEEFDSGKDGGGAIVPFEVRFTRRTRLEPLETAWLLLGLL